MTKTKLIIITRSFAPQVSGSAILLDHLVRDYQGDVSVIKGFGKQAKIDPNFTQPCPTIDLSPPFFLKPFSALINRRCPDFLSRITATQLRSHLARFRPTAVLGAFPNEIFFVAAYQACKRLSIPFFAHMHDLWIENQQRNTALHRFADKWEQKILVNSKRLICMTESMQDFYQRKYKRAGDLLLHSVSSSILSQAPKSVLPPKGPKLTILFVGAVSIEMNLDALRTLAKAVELLPSEYELNLCTSLSREQLIRRGIECSRMTVQFVSRKQVQQIQSESHVLVVPLSFKNGTTEEVTTVFSTKLLEYLVSGRPILAYSPPYSYHAQSARKYGWAHVVDEDSPEALSAGLRQVATDQTLAARLVDNAIAEANRRSAANAAQLLNSWVEDLVTGVNNDR